jgi:cold shock CspA family protein
MRGTIDRLAPEGGFGFIVADGEEFFFHRNGLNGVDFDELAPGSDVEFEIATNTEGDEPGEHRRAVNVHLGPNEMPAEGFEDLPDQKIA